MWHVFNPVLIISPFLSKTLFQPSLLLPRPPMPIERVSLSYPLVLSLRRAIAALSPEPGPRAISDSFCTLSPHPASPARHVQSALRGCFNCHFSFRRRVTSRSGQAGKRRATVIRGDEHNLHAAIITHTHTHSLQDAVCDELFLRLAPSTRRFSAPLGHNLIWQAYCCHLKFVRFEILINELAATFALFPFASVFPFPVKLLFRVCLLFVFFSYFRDFCVLLTNWLRSPGVFDHVTALDTPLMLSGTTEGGSWSCN